MTQLLKFHKKAFFLFIIIFQTLIASCKEKVIKIEQEKKYPVEYIYAIPIDSLYGKITKQLIINNMMLWNAQNKDIMPQDVSTLFSHSENLFDFYLEPVYYLGKSKIYFKENGDSLDYLAGFYIHLQKHDLCCTKVSIKTIEPRIIVGEEFLPKPPHFVKKDKTMAVEPSTIEEYGILIEIGKLVAEHHMSPIILPKHGRSTIFH